ncbi:hypothetical protein L9F63_019997, partial [Diploptera punctata]
VLAFYVHLTVCIALTITANDVMRRGHRDNTILLIPNKYSNAMRSASFASNNRKEYTDPRFVESNPDEATALNLLAFSYQYLNCDAKILTSFGPSLNKMPTTCR